MGGYGAYFCVSLHIILNGMLVPDSVGLQVPGILGSRWLVIKPGTKQKCRSKLV